MSPSKLAKSLGAKSLQSVAEFYGCTAKHLRDVHARNQKGFIAMVKGYVIENQKNDGEGK